MSFAHHRRVNRAISPVNASTAAEAIGPITEGIEVYGITRGDFGLTDILQHIIAETGSRHATLATWTASGKSLGFFADMCRARAFETLRIIVDPSFTTRQPDACAMMFKIYGPDSIRLAPLHAKFAVLSGGRLPATLRTSMNLNPNRRLESYEISTCPEMAAYHLQIADHIFENFGVPHKIQPETQSKSTLGRIFGSAPDLPF